MSTSWKCDLQHICYLFITMAHRAGWSNQRKIPSTSLYYLTII